MAPIGGIGRQQRWHGLACRWGRLNIMCFFLARLTAVTVCIFIPFKNALIHDDVCTTRPIVRMSSKVRRLIVGLVEQPQPV